MTNDVFGLENAAVPETNTPTAVKGSNATVVSRELSSSNPLVDQSNDVVEQGYDEEEVEVLPDNVTVLSSGVAVVINEDGADELSRDMILKIFQAVKIDGKGNVIQTESVSDNIKAASSIQLLQDSLLGNFVTLYRTISEEVELGNVPANWKTKLRRTPILTVEYDFNDPDDVTFMFLKFFAFKTPEDWAILTERTFSKLQNSNPQKPPPPKRRKN